MFGFDLHEIGIQSGERVLVADGQIELWITAIRGGDITARVLVGGECAPHRGVNFPDTDVKVSALNEKDCGCQAGWRRMDRAFVCSRLSNHRRGAQHRW
jgi:hypothetical protein